MATALLPSIVCAAGMEGSCGNLVTEQECKAYIDRLAHAASDAERGALEKEHAAMVKERARFCPALRNQTSNAEARPPRPARNSPRKIWM